MPDPTSIRFPRQVRRVAVVTLSAALGIYVLLAGRRYENQVLVADAHHLLTDVLTTAGVWLGLLLTHLFGEPRPEGPAGALIEET